MPIPDVLAGGAGPPGLGEGEGEPPWSNGPGSRDPGLENWEQAASPLRNYSFYSL